jgi:hypothetical protein
MRGGQERYGQQTDALAVATKGRVEDGPWQERLGACFQQNRDAKER